MLNNCAVWLTKKLYDHCSLDEIKRPVYIYGFELFLSTASSIISILIISAIFFHIYSGCLFLAVFITLRLFSGGYHAETYGRCFILTNCVFLLSVAFSQVLLLFVQDGISRMICADMTITAGLTIFFLSPIRNQNHPLSETRYKKNRWIARILACVLSCASIISLVFGAGSYYPILFSVTLAAVAVMMIIPKLNERRT